MSRVYSVLSVVFVTCFCVRVCARVITYIAPVWFYRLLFLLSVVLVHNRRAVVCF